jgi:hypothetical protein
MEEQTPIEPEQVKGKVLSVGDLTRACNDAAGKMSNLNPHKLLLLNCAYALQQLVRRINELQDQLNPKKVM